MARYAVGINRAALAGAGNYAELRTTATDRVFVQEIGVFVSTAVATSVGLIRPLAIGVTPTTPVTLLAEDSSDPTGTAQIATAWGTAPTIAGTPVYLRRATLPATVGAGIIWTFGGRGLVVPVSSSLLIYNPPAAASGAVDIYIIIDE